MERIIEKLESRKGIFNLHGIPIHDIIGELTEVVVESGYPEEEKVKLAMKNLRLCMCSMKQAMMNRLH